eukprot:scaffold1464_cov86-Skeletonema_dohrnii-CCMP3373.AAC.3
MFSADLISNNSSFAMIALVALWYTCDAMPQICPRMSGPLDCLRTKAINQFGGTVSLDKMLTVAACIQLLLLFLQENRLTFSFQRFHHSFSHAVGRSFYSALVLCTCDA